MRITPIDPKDALELIKKRGPRGRRALPLINRVRGWVERHENRGSLRDLLMYLHLRKEEFNGVRVQARVDTYRPIDSPTLVGTVEFIEKMFAERMGKKPNADLFR